MTTSIYDMFATDNAKETEGFWYDVTPTMSFLLARAGGANVKFVKAVEMRTRPYRRQIDNETLDNEMGNLLAVQAFADAVVLGWKGVIGKNSKKLAFNRENTEKLLLDLPDLFTELRDQATKLANYRNASIEDDSGN